MKICTEDGCSRKFYAKGRCRSCCLSKKGNKKAKRCSSPGCSSNRAFYAGGLCQVHSLEAQGVDTKRRKKDINLRSFYGISLEQAEKMIYLQGGVCGLCGEPMQNPALLLGPTGGSKGEMWVVDHCHTSGSVRGIVHQRCNTALGAVRDDPHKALKVAEYLVSLDRQEALRKAVGL